MLFDRLVDAVLIFGFLVGYVWRDRIFSCATRSVSGGAKKGRHVIHEAAAERAGRDEFPLPC
jgi:hypothetical protein